MQWRVAMKDVDDVEAEPYTFNVTCPQSSF